MLNRLLSPLSSSFSARVMSVIFVVLLFGLTVACGGGMQPVPAPISSKPTDKNSDIAKQPADFALTPEELDAEYQKDKEAAERKYKGKTIELNGIVQKVYGNDPAFIGLKGTKQVLGLQCVMLEKEPWGHVVPGQKVKVKGKWPEFGEKPSLYDCVIVETGPSPAISITAVQLATEYAADPEGVKKKYAGKTFILGGEVLEIRDADAHHDYAIFLKGTDKTHFKLYYAGWQKQQLPPITIGQSIKVFAEVTEFSFDKDEISFGDARPITK